MLKYIFLKFIDIFTLNFKILKYIKAGQNLCFLLYFLAFCFYVKIYKKLDKPRFLSVLARKGAPD